MKTSFLSIFGFALILSALHLPAACASQYDQLTDDQKQQIQNGEQVLVVEDVEGSALPKYFVYQRVSSTAEEAIAVAFDYESGHEYLAKIELSKVSARIDKTTTRVDYRMSLPFGMKENYTLEDHLTHAGESYQIEWKMIRADHSRSINGHIIAEPLGTGALIAYYNLVVPTTTMWGMEGMAREQTVESVQKLKERIESERSAGGPMAAHVSALRAALN